MENHCTYHTLWRQLVPLYDTREAQAIVRTLLQEDYGMTMADVVTDGIERLPQEKKCSLKAQMEKLRQGVPVQQVLGFAWFCDRKYKVSSEVLTPRPETEELCHWILQEQKGKTHVALLDIGTGSGCIACTLSLDLPRAKVTALDISDEALYVAKQNANNLGAQVHFLQADILQQANHTDAFDGLYDVIVSNPPYITHRERTEMHRNVLEHEPHTALFVPDDDPLLFYRAIARFGLHALRPGGQLYLEINPLFSKQLSTLLQDMGYTHIETRKDEQGKERMAKAHSTR